MVGFFLEMRANVVDKSHLDLRMNFISKEARIGVDYFRFGASACQAISD
jgi:hypothetical protein